MEESIIWKLKNARTIVNDGCNKNGVILSGNNCKAVVRWIDDAMIFIMEAERKQETDTAEALFMGHIVDGHPESFPIYKCSNCKTVLERYHKYCWNCGKQLLWQQKITKRR